MKQLTGIGSMRYSSVALALAAGGSGTYIFTQQGQFRYARNQRNLMQSTWFNKPVVTLCEEAEIYSGNAVSESPTVGVSKGVNYAESSQVSLDFLPAVMKPVFPVMCWMLLLSVWLAAAAGPLYALFCLLTGAYDALVTLLLVWIAAAMLKFPSFPSVTETIAAGLEAWLKDFTITYERHAPQLESSSLPNNNREGKTIYCYHPHGLFSIGAVLLAVDLLKRGEKVSFVTSSHMRWFNPLLKLLMDMAGIEIVGASAKEVQAAMKRGDRSLILVPGGYEEAVMTENGFERLFLRDRMGFVKYAMRYGYSLTPVYAFGENDLYTCLHIPARIRDWLARWKIPIVLFYGHKSIPFLPDNSKTGLSLFVGSPVPVVTMSEPSLAQLHAAHAMYVEQVLQLYYRHNPNPDRPLEIV